MAEAVTAQTPKPPKGRGVESNPLAL